MASCDVCDEWFYDRDDRNEHVDDYDHFIECDTCPKQFYTQQSCNQHMRAVNHFPFECDGCYRTFPSISDKEDHMHAVGHWPHYCYDCRRPFKNANNLQQVQRNLFFFLPKSGRHILLFNSANVQSSSSIATPNYIEVAKYLAHSAGLALSPLVAFPII